MTIIRMLTTMAGPDGVVQAGRRVALDDALAATLVEGGYAELVEPWPPTGGGPAAAGVASSEPAEVETTDLPTGDLETATARPQRRKRA